MTAAAGPRSAAVEDGADQVADVPPATGKLSIWAAKTKAAEKPSRGILRGGRVRRASRRAKAQAGDGQTPVTRAVLASRNPSGMCM